MKWLRNTTVFAFCIGFYERIRYGDAFGRTHATSIDWNEAYDRGVNAAEAIRAL